MNKQVTYFEIMVHGAIEKHYTNDTDDFKNWLQMFKCLDTSSRVTYIAYSDGTAYGHFERR